MINYLQTTATEFQRQISDEARRAHRWCLRRLDKVLNNGVKRTTHDHPLVIKSKETGHPVYDQSILYNPTTTGNRWYVLRYVEDYEHIEYGMYKDFFHIVGIDNKQGYYQVYYVILNADKKESSFICVFPVHFWSRYKQRSDTKLEGEEMILDFFRKEIRMTYYFDDMIRPGVRRQNKKYRNVVYNFNEGQGRGVCLSQDSQIYECRTYIDDGMLTPMDKYKRRWQEKYKKMYEKKVDELNIKYYGEDDIEDKAVKYLARDFDLQRAFYRSCGENAKRSDTMAMLCVLYNIIEDSLPHSQYKHKRQMETVTRNQHKLVVDFAHSHGAAKNISIASDDVVRFMVEAAELASNHLNPYEVIIFLDAFNRAADGRYGNLDELAEISKKVVDDAREHPDEWIDTWHRAEAMYNRIKNITNGE